MPTESSVSRVLEMRGERRAIVPPAPVLTLTPPEPVLTLATSKTEPVMLKDEDLVDDDGDGIVELFDFLEVEPPPAVKVEPTATQPTPAERFAQEWATMERLRALDMQNGYRFNSVTISSIRRLMLIADNDVDRQSVWIAFAEVLEFNAGFWEVADEELADWFEQESAASRRSLDEAMGAARRAVQLINDEQPIGERIVLLKQLIRHLNARRSPEARSFEMQLQNLLSLRP